MSETTETSSNVPQAQVETTPQENQTPETGAQTNTVSQGVSVQRPEGLSDAFWDTEKNEVKLNDLLADHGTLSKYKSEMDAKFTARPESMDKYELRIPDSVTLPDGVTFEFDQDSPLVKSARQMAFDAGMGQEGFDSLVATYLDEKLQTYSKSETEAQEAYQAELVKLGERGKERVSAVESYLKSTLTDTEYTAIRGVATTAEGVAAIEKLMGNARDVAPKLQGAGGADNLSESDLREMMKDPKYWRDRDPAFISKVSDGFKKLFPNKVATSV